MYSRAGRATISHHIAFANERPHKITLEKEIEESHGKLNKKIEPNYICSLIDLID